jgi:hypothetical protein
MKKRGWTIEVRAPGLLEVEALLKEARIKLLSSKNATNDAVLKRLNRAIDILQAIRKGDA